MANAIEKVQKIQWHPGFVGGLKISLREYSDKLEYKPEYQLTKAPLYTDLLVIRKNSPGVIDNDIARIFRGHNVIEYKSPDDSLNIDALYKTLGYACLYKASGKKKNEIPGDELTVTLVRNAKPIAMFKEIRRLGGEVKECAEGVYRVTGIVHIPVQVVIPRVLEGDEFAGLRVLSKNPSEADIRAFVDKAVQFSNPGDKQDADAVLQVSISANRKIYDGIKGRDTTMCEALRELMKPEFEAMEAELKAEFEAKEAEFDRRVRSMQESMQEESDRRVKSMQEESDKREEVSTVKKIKSIMEKLKYTAEQAMELLDIPAKEQSKYLRML